MMTQYSDGLILVWNQAALEAEQAGQAMIPPGFFFAGLCAMCELPLEMLLGNLPELLPEHATSICREVGELKSLFRRAGLDAEKTRRRLLKALEFSKAGGLTDVMHRTPAAQQCFRRAEEICRSLGETQIRPAHLFVALIETPDAAWRRLISNPNLQPATLLESMSRNAGDTDGEVAQHWPGQERAERQHPPAPNRRVSITPSLDEFGRDLTHLAREGRLAPVIGQQAETVIDRLEQTLLRQRLNNAILVGEPGVGKTAAVEGLAQRIGREPMRPEFEGRRLVELEMGRLLAGTRNRGDFEERLLATLTEAADHNIIVFIDEIHTVVGAGAAAGGPDAANMLKRHLQRVCCIGATTPGEFRSRIEADRAFTRRFQLIPMEEPTSAEAIAILKGIRASLETHHRLMIDQSAIEASVELSVHHAPDRRLPAKALELLDGVCAWMRVNAMSGLQGPTVVNRSDVSALVQECSWFPSSR